ncbi:response regulator [Noviherbaspirillum sp. CPCC 100848]|uniref:Response regulator n=1 Tax=Noviherbaspirillum album TaxID=3080276 RepID=A0ABU6JBB1_9BURK|nr:response regulator [Noviherbaspirillum sp. CPCC 100848]MEC4720552.1 response regulator [Noviherbaspirillum sp. CPCC 100848]
MLKVAVLDANAISRNLLTSVLIGGGHDVVGDANISAAGMAAMIKLQPQLVCIDIGTPDDEGFARLDNIRTSLPKALVFLVSGKMEAATVQRAMESGVHGFIVKPFNGATVLTSIRNAIIKIAKQHRQAATSNKPAD